jgi:hypothetical protein
MGISECDRVLDSGSTISRSQIGDRNLSTAWSRGNMLYWKCSVGIGDHWSNVGDWGSQIADYQEGQYNIKSKRMGSGLREWIELPQVSLFDLKEDLS